MPPFTFDETLPTERDYCRFRLDDADPDDYRLTDVMYDTLLAKYGLYDALLEACNRIKLYYGKQETLIGLSGGKRFAYANQYKAYADLYDQLLGEAAFVGNAGGGTADGDLPMRDVDLREFMPYQPFTAPFVDARNEAEQREWP